MCIWILMLLGYILSDLVNIIIQDQLSTTCRWNMSGELTRIEPVSGCSPALQLGLKFTRIQGKSPAQ